MAEAGHNPAIRAPWSKPTEEILRDLEVDAEQGLSTQHARMRRRKYGPNRLRSAKGKSAWEILIEQFKSLLVLLLAVAAIVSVSFGEVVEGIAIGAVILVNTAIGFATELRAVRSMEALQRMGTVHTKVRRNGRVQEISAEKLVPGDIVVLEGGDVITADLRLFEASRLQADESTLTGESMPVGKGVEPVDKEAGVGDRASMAHKGTSVTRGAGEGVVVATGMDTELGHISSLVEEAEEERTPLEERLDKLGHKLVWITLAIAVVVTISGILAGQEILPMIETGIALAVATVPEGLPIVATIALARGMRRMARRNALINRLSAVETLGATNVIFTDKTGTLTENQMTLVEIRLACEKLKVTGEGLQTEGRFVHKESSVAPLDHPVLRRALQVGVLCNNAELNQSESGEGNEAVGEPLEIALLVAGAKAGLERDRLLEEAPEVREVAFDPDTKMMATFHASNGNYRVAAKGAPEAILNASGRILTREGPRDLEQKDVNCWIERNREMAGEGLRVLGLATKEVDSEEAEPYKDLTFLGLFGLLDPPREEVAPSLQACQAAGVRVIMVTGDHPVTALKIAMAVGLVEDESVKTVQGQELAALEERTEEERERLLDAPIFARVSPEQKLDVISLYQEHGDIVAMTGDGVNDAPALKKADIGVAMGQRGTQVARDAADMVLEDDRFSTIVTAIEQGRVIFGNIRKFVLYLLSCNMSEIAVISLASLANAPLPIQPLQILYLNLVTDVFPALALGVGEGEETVMQHPPRDPQEPILVQDHWVTMGVYSLVITAAVLGVFGLALTWLDMGNKQAVTVSFLTLAFAQLWHVFNMRNRESGMLDNEIVRNPWIWGALALCLVLLLAAVYVPGLNTVLKVTDPGLNGWILVAGASVLPLIVGQTLKSMGWGRTG
ncbi:MAG: cation-translocating P-type ATPase [Anaerolineae bacterium]